MKNLKFPEISIASQQSTYGALTSALSSSGSGDGSGSGNGYLGSSLPSDTFDYGKQDDSMLDRIDSNWSSYSIVADNDFEVVHVDGVSDFDLITYKVSNVYDVVNSDGTKHSYARMDPDGGEDGKSYLLTDAEFDDDVIHIIDDGDSGPQGDEEFWEEMSKEWGD